MRRFSQIAKLLVIACVVGAIVYWVKFSPVRVSEHHITQGEIAAQVMGTGTLEARVQSIVSPKIAGRITEILVDQGDPITAGQLLFRLDDADLKQQVEIAAANVDSAKAALQRLASDQTQALAIVEQATRSHERAQRLAPSGAVSEEDADRALESFRVAQAGVARAEAARIEGRTQLVAAEKNLAYRQTLLADSRVLAPFAGLVVRRDRDPGDIVVPGSPALTVIALEEMWVSAWVDETEMADLAVGQSARVVFRSEPEQGYQGEVARLGREADRETREFVVDVRVLDLPTNWAVGQRAEVYIETARKSAVLVVPTSFIEWQDSQPGVYRRSGQRAEWQSVKLGLQSREQAEVVEGLQDGDVVVTAQGGREIPLAGRKLVAP